MKSTSSPMSKRVQPLCETRSLRCTTARNRLTDCQLSSMVGPTFEPGSGSHSAPGSHPATARAMRHGWPKHATGRPAQRRWQPRAQPSARTAPPVPVTLATVVGSARSVACRPSETAPRPVGDARQRRLIGRVTCQPEVCQEIPHHALTEQIGVRVHAIRHAGAAQRRGEHVRLRVGAVQHGGIDRDARASPRSTSAPIW